MTLVSKFGIIVAEALSGDIIAIFRLKTFITDMLGGEENWDQKEREEQKIMRNFCEEQGTIQLWILKFKTV